MTYCPSITSTPHQHQSCAQNTQLVSSLVQSWHKEHARDHLCFLFSFPSSRPGANSFITALHSLHIFPHIPQLQVAHIVDAMPTTTPTFTQTGPSDPWVSQSRAHRILDVVLYAYPILLLIFFIAAFTIRTILAAEATTLAEEQPKKAQFGPGGKPLPIRSLSYRKIPPFDFSSNRKLVFQWLSVLLCLTFVGNATIVCLQALFRRHEGWWCGQAVTVSRL